MIAAAAALVSCSSSVPGPAPTHNTARPPARVATAAAWDAGRHELVLFGGHTPGADAPQVLGDTWTWDAVHGWLAHPAATGGPPPRAHAGMAYDPELGAVLLLGGQAGGLPLVDSWMWNGMRWTPGPALPADVKPDGAYHIIGESAALAWDPAHHDLVAVVCCTIIGGPWNAPVTLTGDGHTWKSIDTTTVLPGRDFMQLSVDPQTGRLYLLDADDYGSNVPATAWTWDGGDWSAAGPVPAGTPSPNTVDDPRSLLAWSPGDRGVADVVEAASGPASVWLLRNGAWASGPQAPGLGRVAALVDDPADGRLLAVAGPSEAHDTDAVWQRTASGWSPAGAGKPIQATPAIPVPSEAPAPFVGKAKDYVPGASAYGSGFFLDTRVPPAPAGEDAPSSAVDSWEAFFEGPGQKLVQVVVVVFADSAAAHGYLSSGFPLRFDQGSSVVMTPPSLGQDPLEEQEPITIRQNGAPASLVHIAWREGRVAILYSYRDLASTINPAAALPGARALEAQALRIASGH